MKISSGQLESIKQLSKRLDLKDAISLELFEKRYSKISFFRKVKVNKLSKYFIER